jgi:hypothetical protein
MPLLRNSERNRLQRNELEAETPTDRSQVSSTGLPNGVRRYSRLGGLRYR